MKAIYIRLKKPIDKKDLQTELEKIKDIVKDIPGSMILVDEDETRK